MKFTIGTDPELMLEMQTSTGKHLVSAIGRVPGDKYKRHKIGKHEYYYDNVMAECAVAPSETKAGLVENLRDCFQQYADLVNPLKLIPQASADYPISELQHDDAKAIGCDPELCVYSLTEAEAPKAEFRSGLLRTCGGHIHLGAPICKDEYGSLFVIRMLDLFLGIPSIYIDKDKTTKRRKKLYGKAGRFRLPEHGVEYRSLGNFWLRSPATVELIYDICEFTLNFVAENRHLKLWKVDFDTLKNDDSWNDPDFQPSNCYQCHGYDVIAMRHAFDEMDKSKGQKFMKLVQELMPTSLYLQIDKFCTSSNSEGFYKAWRIK